MSDNNKKERFRLACEYWFRYHPLENPSEATRGKTFEEKVEAIRQDFFLDILDEFPAMTSDEVSILDDVLENIGFPKISGQFKKLSSLLGDENSKKIWGDDYQEAAA